MSQWRLTFTCSPHLADNYLAILEEETLSLGWYETADANMWGIEAFFAKQPNLPELSTRLALIAAQLDSPIPQPVCENVDNTDWLEQTWRNFPPQKIARYYVYGSHYAGDIPQDLLGIEMNAATAFGSGEHPTTQGCLQALDTLAKKRSFAKALDMGCGSGILALAIAKTWQCPVLAVDNDAEAVRVTAENIVLNQCTPWINSLVSEGFADATVSTQGPYPLIVANILAKPLCVLAPCIAKNLAREGILILSGLLSWQAAEVLAAYASVGLAHTQTYTIDNWTTLVLQQPLDPSAKGTL